MTSPTSLPPGVTAAVLRVNGEDYPVVFPTHHTLLEVLREKCGLTGTKHGCELGECGACAVRVDGEAVLSCLKLAVEAQGCAVQTVEGLQNDNELHPLQRTFADFGAAQCGYCTPGILMVASALLDRNDDPDDAEIFRSAVRKPVPVHRIPPDRHGGALGGRDGEGRRLAAARRGILRRRLAGSIGATQRVRNGR